MRRGGGRDIVCLVVHQEGTRTATKLGLAGSELGTSRMGARRITTLLNSSLNDEMSETGECSSLDLLKLYRDRYGFEFDFVFENIKISEKSKSCLISWNRRGVCRCIV